jgi:6-phospho-3-hexuloisomerase
VNPFHTALAELQATTDALDLSAVAAASALIADAGRIVAYGCGREGLQLRGFVMRLYHLGLRASMQGDMTTPALGPGDLLICSAGPGELATVTALMRVAQTAGVDVLFLTAEPKTGAAVLATQVLHIPAQTMASDRAGAADKPGQSALPMGSLYEGAMFLLFEVMVLDLRERLDQTPSEMRARHTNME